MELPEAVQDLVHALLNRQLRLCAVYFWAADNVSAPGVSPRRDHTCILLVLQDFCGTGCQRGGATLT
jgi:hypothetical protein